MMNQTKYDQRLIADFGLDYEQLRRNFDKFEQEDSFSGPQLEKLVKKFLRKWSNFIEENCKYSDDVISIIELKRHSNRPSTYLEALEEDLRLVQSECNYKRIEDPDANYWNNYKQGELSVAKSELQALISDIYRRACEAVYLRVTFNKARLKQEDDRREAVRLGQRAIRYNPNNVKSCLWYSVVLGWSLDAVSAPRERVVAGETFKWALRRTISMEPREALAHHLLGIYYYHVANMNWFQRSFAKNFLGGKLEGSFEEAESEFKLVYGIKNDWLPTGLWMAKTLLAQENRSMDEVRHWISLGLQLEANEPTTEIDRDELLELAKRLKVAWSRNQN